MVLLILPVLAEDSGFVTFQMRGVTVQDNQILVVRDGEPANLSYLPDHTDGVGDNPGVFVATTLPDGISEIYRMSAGEYVAYLRQGNADQPEEQKFVVVPGEITRVTFLGAAYASGDEGCCSCHNITVTTPTYTIHHDEINHTVLHPAGVEVVTVIDTPAWTETKIITEEWWEYVIDRLGHWEYRTLPNGVWSDDYIYGCTHTEDVTGYNEVMCLTPVKRCETRWITELWHMVLHPAVTEEVYHPASTHTETRTVGKPWYEIIVDVPAWDEQVWAVTHEERVCGQRLVCPCGCVKREAVHG